MSQLTLIRHGQAAAFTSDSDRLTDLGRRQAQKLGAYLVAANAHFDEVFTGTLKRQLETEQLVAEAMCDARLPWPQAHRTAGWNEYDAGAIMGKLAPALAERDQQFARLTEDFRANAESRERNRYFQRMFELLMDCWVSGEIAVDGVEAFEAFHDRVTRARADILERAGSRKVAVFTSGGPIGVCVQLTLQSPKPIALRLNWRVKNCSLTELMFSGTSRLSLDSFNTTPHLDSDELLSFR
jgi:broad specificity phosphatase PhoE